MACQFCATGREGLTRNLTAAEIIAQVALVQEDFQERVSNVVVMGQGEPFLNYDEVLAALRILNSRDDFNIGARHITLSTCGIIDGIVSPKSQSNSRSPCLFIRLYRRSVIGLCRKWQSNLFRI